MGDIIDGFGKLMGTVTYKNQPGTATVLKAGTPLVGTSHLYTVKKILWPTAVSEYIDQLLIPQSLHVCSGYSKLGNVRLDADPLTQPDVIADASSLPFEDGSFESVLCDPPYNGRFQWNHNLLKELSRVARRRIIFQHWFVPVDSKGNYKKAHKFQLTQLYLWQPKTYFGRAQIISVFDNEKASIVSS